MNGDEEQQNEAVSMLRSMHQVGKEQLKALVQSIKGKKKNNFLALNDKEMERYIYDAESRMSRPGKLVREEGQPSNGDSAVNKAYDSSGATFDFFDTYFGRKSIDGKGMPTKATVHFGKNYNNAFWDGVYVTFGDGDGKIFNPFINSICVVAHELAHGVTEHEAGLTYFAQSGALNEHFSDVFGILVKQEVNKETAETSSWLIGEGLFTDKIVNGKALRSFAAPGTAYGPDPVIGKDRQPSHYRDYKEIDEDNGGVHLYSGLCNLSFYTAAMELGGKPAETLGKIWYQTLCEELKPTSQFKDMVEATLKVATKLHGSDSKEVKAVRSGWLKVGLL